jgi:hypothetical protein
VARDLEIYIYSRWHITAIVKDEDGNPIWKLIGFYGHLESARGSESWALLQHLKTIQPTSWLCFENFNEILKQLEKEGASIRQESQMEGFRTVLEICQLCDLGYSGSHFTWSNNRMDDSFTKERLELALANMEWFSRFQSVMVKTLAARTSDHSPILISFCDEAPKQQTYKPGFKYEAS